jgi:hypothetical protein
MRLAIAVLSCDKYKDLWAPFFELFFKNWPDCPYDVMLFANKESFSDARVKTVLSGPDHDWSSSVKACLKQIDYDYVMLLFDDGFIMNKVDQKKISELVSFIELNKPDYQKFTAVPKPDIRINSKIGKYLPTTHYRNGLMSIWKRETLLSLLVEGESAWAFELNGLKRSAPLEHFYGVYEEYFDFLHGVEKGLWYQRSVKILQKQGIKIDLAARGVLTSTNHFRSQLSLLRRYIFLNVPAPVRPYLFKASDFVRSKITKKW